MFGKKCLVLALKSKILRNSGIYFKELVIFNHHAKFQIDMSIIYPAQLNLVQKHYAKL